MRKIVFVFLCFSCGVKTADTDSSALVEQPSPDSTKIGFDENNYESFLDLANYLVVENPDSEKVRVIDSTAVIVIYPSSEQVTEMEEKYGEDFATIVDDASFYQAEAMMRIDSVGVRKIVLSPDDDFVHLKSPSKNWLLGVRKEGAPEWNMIFFHINKEPEIVSSIDVTTDKIREFFGK
jgi:hypothetical protein